MDAVDETHEENQGEVIVFAYVERLRAMCDEWRAEDGAKDTPPDEEGVDADADADADADVWDPEALEAELAALAAERTASSSASAPESAEALEDELDARTIHGAPFTVKKSTFQAHVCGGLTDASQVDAVMSALRRTVKSPGRRTTSWRIASAPPRHGGRVGAGPRRGRRERRGQGIITPASGDARGERVRGGESMVRRHPPRPDRFKVINNVARDLLEACGEIERKGDGKGARR